MLFPSVIACLLVSIIVVLPFVFTERCEVSTTIDICQSFGIFNNTFYPNQWNFNSERDAIEKGYKPFGLRPVSTGCSNSTLFYLCSVLFPPCDGLTFRKPCTDVCSDVTKECKDILFDQPCESFADDSPNCLRPPAQKVCGIDEFSCHGSHQCIPNSSVCDGSMDCADWSDERNCVCNEYQFKCDMGMCIKNYQQCDKIGDCPDISDEMNCTCPLGQFACNDGKCIVPEWVCDNQRDCSQNEDEANCPSCVDGQFRCLSGECILASHRCDGTPQCADQSDERQCIIEVSESYPFLLKFDDWLPVCATNFTDELADLTCRKFGNLAAVNWSSTAYPYYLYAHVDPNGDTTSIIGKVTLRSTCPNDMCVYVNCEPRGCGQRAKTMTQTIVNGEDASPGVWPWQISMQRIGKHYCGGSLISPNFVVTAAHCIEQYKLEFSFIDIVLGATKLAAKESMQVKRKIKRLVLHNHIFHERNDIALIQLNRPVEYTDYVRPICLPDATEKFTRSNQCYAVGWGMKAWNTSFSNRLQQAKMTLWDTKKCNSSLAWNGAVGDTFICAGYYSGLISTCSGDSGGSLVCQANDYNWYLVGISSYVAKGCNVPERPVVFSDAQFFTPWIHNHTQCIFTCGNGHCIYDVNQLCNRENDCGDNSDEIKPCHVTVNCTFDDPFLCGYDVNWDRLSATDFVNHYPLYDHTIGSYPGFYMVGRARGLLLTTPRFTAQANTCLRFFYHMRGDIAGGIQVWFNQYFPNGTDTWEPVYKKKDVTMPDKWQMGQFDLKDGEFEIVFLTNVASRVAIDDVMILNQSCASAGCSSDEMQCGTGIDKQCIDKRSRCNLVTDCARDEDEVNCVGSSYYCDFNNPVLCGLQQVTTDNELVEWRVVNSSKTPGAFQDHSYTETGNMLVMETRSLLKDKEVSMTQSLYLGGEAHCFQFYYYSDTTGTLEVSYKEANSTVKNILWVVSNRITLGWAKTQFSLPALDTIHLTYNMIGGNFDGTYRPFLALDDLNITRGQCPAFECGAGLVACSEENYCLPETSYCNRKVDCAGGSDEVSCVCKSTEYKCPGGPCIDRSLTCDRVYHCADHSDEGDICDPFRKVSCDFEHPFLCGYRFQSTDYKWRRYFGKTTTFGTGPTADHTYKNISGHYVYADGSEGRYSALTYAESPRFNATGKSLSFYYHLFSILATFNSNTGSLMLIVKDYDLGQNYTLLAEVPTQEKKWKYACVDLPPSDDISLVFVAQRGDDLLADDKAIDDIVLQDGKCKIRGVTGETSPPLLIDTTPT
ncbi:MAM and LDL-receptor class A domain-containing protein 2 isoform X2 [Patella vulgata]|uniref:MAM and LDL-receptor class A domain-containing protein 2 isoform X2 n=1 Tax=Patella vulgata TaxID=6465 RepID=UPI00217FB3B2|nr:MAM and LDL-receptor class A domain-containing protein 2 isoform X2 [Patella vulgata]